MCIALAGLETRKYHRIGALAECEWETGKEQGKVRHDANDGLPIQDDFAVRSTHDRRHAFESIATPHKMSNVHKVISFW